MEKTAAQWLDHACHFETEGEERKAELALSAAIRKDEKEHAADDPKTASLPRKGS